MSYCRWSSDDFRCDVYVYESDRGFEIHVASNRVVFAEPLPDPVPLLLPDGSVGDVAAYTARSRAVHDLIDRSAREPIGLPHDGESFCYDTPGEAAARLQALAEVGYRVPASVVATLVVEESEADAAYDALTGPREDPADRC